MIALPSFLYPSRGKQESSSFGLLGLLGRFCRSDLLVWAGILVGAFLSARLVALMVTTPMLPGMGASGGSVTASEGTPPAIHGPPPRSLFEEIERNNLLGLNTHGVQKARTVAPPPPPAKPTFDAVLMGTMGNFDQQTARAIIQFQGTQHVMGPGQSLAGFTLVKLSRREAVFQGHDTEVLLTFDRPGEPLPIIIP